MIITDENFTMIAAKAYQNPSCLSIAEFKKDLRVITKIKKQVTRFKEGSEKFEPRLLVNNVLEIFNVFGSTGAFLILHKVDYTIYPQVLAVFNHLSRLPEHVPNGSKKVLIPSTSVPVDEKLFELLEEM